jgi:hypothetical protein
VRLFIIVAFLLAIGLIYFFYKREKDVSKLLLSSAVLIGIVTLGIVGNIMRSLLVLYIAHDITLLLSYGGLLYYIVRGKTQWILWSLPVVSLVLFLVILWVGNEHI